jgi:hypothetical protein
VKAKTAETLAGITGQMSALAEDMRRTTGGLFPKPTMAAAATLEAYRNGERVPVEGPFTYVEALALVTLNKRLLDALKDIVSIPHGSGAKTLQARSKAHYNACAIIAEAEAE